MSSLAFSSFENSIAKATHFISLSGDSRLRPISEVEKQNTLHASLALIVAAWDVYVKNISREFYTVVSNPLSPNYHQIHTISLNHLNTHISKFNTPNAENCRNILLSCTGYDPWSDWIWLRRHYSSQQTRDFLNEILKIRHSFAHGHSMPSFSWNTSSSGVIRLTSKNALDCLAFFRFLTLQTDQGMNNHLKGNYCIDPHWY